MNKQTFFDPTNNRPSTNSRAGSTAAPRYVAYYRVSTAKQGQSGLGLEAQRQSVREFVYYKQSILAEYIEQESGKMNEREELEKAIAHAKEQQARLVIAKLDRLSRSVSFIFTLRDSGVDFVCVDMPETNTLTIGVLASMAQHEREQISERTRKALQAKKARGFILGTPENLTDEARARGRKAQQKAAAENRVNLQMGAMIELYRSRGMTYQTIADELNRLRFRTRRGYSFGAATVRKLYLRHCEREGIEVIHQVQGNYGENHHNLPDFSVLRAREARQRNARTNEANIKASLRIVALRKEGLSYQKIADRLNKEGYKTRRGCRFEGKGVKRLWDRWVGEK